jgi:chemotaxis protein MotA
MDITAIVGLIAAIACLMVGIGPNLSSVIDAPVLIVVVGGTLATVLISNPLQDVVNLVGIYHRAIFVKVPVPTELIERIVAFAETARREGILAVGRQLTPDDDPFLAQGARLAVAGQEPDLIMDILRTELLFIQERHAHAQRMVGSLGISGLVFGGIGATLAITFRLGPEAAGLAVASTAALPLTYGLVIFGVFAEPFRRKLRTYGEKESLAKRLIIEGVMLIQSSDTPRIVEHKLSVFLPPKDRPTGYTG